MTSRILIGDDNEQIRKSLARTLKLRKLETDLASTPEEVIRKAKANNYSAIITDLEYTEGGREGYEVLRQIKETPSVKILYTGQIGFEFLAEGLANGADYVVLRKEISQLTEVLDKIIRGKMK